MPAGTFTLMLVGSSADNGTAGELDIDANVTIQGKGAGQTIIDGNNTDRVIEVLGGNVSIKGVTIQHGRVTSDGGGILNNGGRLSLSSVVVANNVAVGAVGSFGGGNGGNGALGNAGGNGGEGVGGAGGAGGAGGVGQGGGIFNGGGATLTSTTTLAISTNVATGGTGGSGGAGGNGIAGIPSTGGRAIGGTGGDSGEGASGVGGGIFNATTGTLTLKPRLGVTKGSRQAKATDVITTNKALAATGGQAGAGGSATGGLGRPSLGVNGVNGVATPGQPGVTDLFSAGVGGGIANVGTALVDNTTISGNQASTSDPNVNGNLKS